MSLTVIEPGLLSLVQDGGRPGLGHLGVSPSGAFDRDALRVANLLVGNAPQTAAVEALGGGLTLRADAAHVIAVAGAPCDVAVDGVQMSHGRAVHVAAGQILRVGSPVAGLRAYIGVAGGLVAPTELGSASTDTLAALGPEPLRAGDVLSTGIARPAPGLDDVPALIRSGDLTLDIVLGPRDDWFSAEAIRRLLENPWQVSAASNRIGVRLTGPRLDRARTEELSSEPCVRGSVQVAADGQPIVFGPDHPVTGGYPVIAVVIDAHTDLLAQARPGQIIRFRRIHLR